MRCAGSQNSEISIIDRVKATLAAPRDTRPCVTLTYAQSLDGCIAANPGAPTDISGDATRKMSHRLRALHDAILVGINTVLVDDPQLTVRLVDGWSPRPIIVDSMLRTPPHARVLTESKTSPLLVTTERACPERAEKLTEAGAEILRIPSTPEGLVDLRALMQILPKHGVQSVLVEGGAHIITSVFTEYLADQVVVTIAPRILGGVPSVRPLRALNEATRPRLAAVCYEVNEPDLVLHGELARPT
jgi:3,4-dihydroxy 2-butanone 4-phosphate synthase/GTP cyclohydrolase II